MVTPTALAPGGNLLDGTRSWSASQSKRTIRAPDADGRCLTRVPAPWVLALVWVVVFMVMLMPSPSKAQDFKGVFRFGDVGDDAVSAIASDPHGGLWLAGTFTDQIDLDPGPGTFLLSRPGQGGGFVVHLDRHGRFLSGGEIDAWPLSIERIAISGDGEIAVVGSFSGTADFDPGSGEFTLVSSGSNRDGFVLRLDSSGGFRWAGSIGGGGNDIVFCAAYSTGHRLVVGGAFSSAADLDPGPAVEIHLSVGNSDGFLMVLDESGNRSWLGIVGGVLSQAVRDLAIDREGRLVVVGAFSGVADLDPGPGVYNVPGHGISDGYVFLLDKMHQLLAGARIGGPGIDFVDRVAFDPEGAIVLAGEYSQGAQLAPNPVDEEPFVSQGSRDVFVERLDLSLRASWIRVAGGLQDDQVTALAASRVGEIYVAGLSSLYVSFEVDRGQFQFAGYDQSFLWNLTSDGDFDWAAPLRSEARNSISALAAVGSDELLYGGSFQGDADFDLRATEHELASAGHHDGYLALLRDGAHRPRRIHVPRDWPSIQEAIDHSRPFDTIVVKPGAYEGLIDFHGQNVHLRSAAGAESTILEGSGDGPVVLFKNGEGRAATLDGFTIRNGIGHLSGGGISILGWSSPTIAHNVISGNVSCGGGGGIEVRGSGRFSVTDNLIVDNHQLAGCSGGLGGGGILVRGDANIEIARNRFLRNGWESAPSGGGGISLSGTSAAVIHDNVFESNFAGRDGGAVYIHGGAAPTLAQNIIFDNEAGSRGGGVYWSQSSQPLVTNNSFVGNRAGEGSAVFNDRGFGVVRFVNNIVDGETGSSLVGCSVKTPSFLFNDFWNLGGPLFSGDCVDPTGSSGNLSEEPRFVDVAKRDFRLQPDSPLIDAGSNSAPYLEDLDAAGETRVVDGDGDGIAIVDMGALERQRPTDPIFSDGFESGDTSAWGHPSG